MNGTSLYTLRRSLGQCGKCGHPPVPGCALCEEHRRYGLEAARRNAARARQIQRARRQKEARA